MVRAMAPTLRRRPRGRWLLLGVDIVLDERLWPSIIEANTNPELTVDAVRSRLNRQLAADMFDLLVETHMKARPLFAADPPGSCTSEAFSEPPAASEQAAGLLTTRVPRWTLLYSEAVRPPYSAAPTANGTECYWADSDRKGPITQRSV